MIGMLAALSLACSPRSASVTVHNEAHLTITELRIANQQADFEKTVTNLTPGQKTTIRVPVRGEGTYSIAVRFEDGRVLNDARYFEATYHIKETVRHDRIDPEFGLYY